MVKKIFEDVYVNSKEDDFVILRKKTPSGKNAPANQSAAYNWRYKRYEPNDKHLKEFSEHSSGTAIDINTSFNPFYCAKGTNKYEGTEYDKYVIKKDSLLVKTFKKYGWSWGGEWKNCKDYMHFEWFSKNFPKT